MPFSPRRLAALDMAGAGNGRKRRWVILIEFLAGAVLCGVVGGYLVLAGKRGPPTTRVVAGGGRLRQLSPTAFGSDLRCSVPAPGPRLAGVDRRSELVHYAWLQLWIIVPGAVVVAAVADETRPHRPLGASPNDAGALPETEDSVTAETESKKLPEIPAQATTAADSPRLPVGWMRCQGEPPPRTTASWVPPVTQSKSIPPSRRPGCRA